MAKVHFTVEIGVRESTAALLDTREERHRSAFASCAHEDRPQVLARIQGIQKALPGMSVFLDVASLRSGEHWAERLSAEVVSKDIFYLFWSKAASQSAWVEREWRAALEKRGIEYIDPVPLAPPEVAPPPKELADRLHFNDWVLAFMRAARQ